MCEARSRTSPLVLRHVLVVVAALQSPVAVWGSTTETPVQAELEILGRAAGEGEQCLVCRQPVHGATMVEVRYKGRIFHVKEEMMDELRADPDAYFRLVQSRSALFDEDALEGAMGTEKRQRGWLFFGLYMLLGLSTGAVCGALAVSRSLPPLPWFFAGLVANLLAVAWLLTRPRGDSAGPEGVPPGLVKVPRTRAPRPCPHCGGPNHPAASVCARCQGRLTPEVSAEIPSPATGGR